MADIEKIKSIISQGESLNIEFKQSRDSLSRSVFETIFRKGSKKDGEWVIIK
jgi:hypothetical protein